MHQELRQLISRHADQSLNFQDVMTLIRRHYECTPVAFRTGVGTTVEVANPAGTNAASSQLLAFARRLGLDEQTTLNLYAEHYRAVLSDPGGNSHGNIRAFIAAGWPGVVLADNPLRLRGPG